MDGDKLCSWPRRGLREWSLRLFVSSCHALLLVKFFFCFLYAPFFSKAAIQLFVMWPDWWWYCIPVLTNPWGLLHCLCFFCLSTTKTRKEEKREKKNRVIPHWTRNHQCPSSIDEDVELVIIICVRRAHWSLHVRARALTHTHACKHARTHALTYTHTQTHARTYTHAHTNTPTHTHTHTQTHEHTNTHIHIHTHTYTHTHTCSHTDNKWKKWKKKNRNLFLQRIHLDCLLVNCKLRTIIQVIVRHSLKLSPLTWSSRPGGQSFLAKDFLDWF